MSLDKRERALYDAGEESWLPAYMEPFKNTGLASNKKTRPGSNGGACLGAALSFYKKFWGAYQLLSSNIC